MSIVDGATMQRNPLKNAHWKYTYGSIDFEPIFLFKPERCLSAVEQSSAAENTEHCVPQHQQDRVPATKSHGPAELEEWQPNEFSEPEQRS